MSHFNRPIVFALILLIGNLCQAQDYRGFRNTVTRYTQTANTVPQGTHCACNESLQFLSGKLSWLADQVRVFERNIRAPAPQDLLMAIDHTIKSAHHLDTEVWQTKQVHAALKGIITACQSLQDRLNKKNSNGFQGFLKGNIGQLNSHVTNLDNGIKANDYHSRWNEKKGR